MYAWPQCYKKQVHHIKTQPLCVNPQTIMFKSWNHFLHIALMKGEPKKHEGCWVKRWEIKQWEKAWGLKSGEGNNIQELKTENWYRQKTKRCQSCEEEGILWRGRKKDDESPDFVTHSESEGQAKTVTEKRTCCMTRLDVSVLQFDGW